MDSNRNAYRVLKYMKILVSIVVFGLILTIVIFAITVASLAKINKEFDAIPIITITTTASTQLLSNATLAASINIDNAMNHLQELQRIANAGAGNRAVITIGFNNTLDYIIDTLKNHTNYNVTTKFFPVRQFVVLRAPTFISSINDTIQNHTYTGVSATSEFYYVQFSSSINLTDYVELSVIPIGGCTDTDWVAANPPPESRVALVKRGNCSFGQKTTLASKYNVTALLLYNHGRTPNDISPILVNAGQSNTVPVLFLSYTLGQELADAAQDPAANVSVLITIDVNDGSGPVGNICADTPTGDPTQTILIGSHSDSVPAGPGINDNGKLYYSPD
jgi:aminopeptidase Y